MECACITPYLPTIGHQTKSIFRGEQSECSEARETASRDDISSTPNELEPALHHTAPVVPDRASAGSSGRPHLSPSTVEKGEDSLGAGAKFPVAPSTCRVRSINAQSSLWAISGGVIPVFGREARRKSRSRTPMWICPRLLWKSMRTVCAQVENPLAYQRPAGRGHERPKRSLFGPVLSPPNVDKPEDSLGGVCKKPCRSGTCRSRARKAH